MAFHRYDEGDVVWCLMEVRKLGVSPRLEFIFEGPFVIKKKFSELDVLLQLDSKGTEKPVHHNKSKPYEGVNAPRWVMRARRQLSRSRSSE